MILYDTQDKCFCKVSKQKAILPVLSSDKFEPCLDGGLLPGLLPVLDVGLEFDLEAGVDDILYDDDGLRGVRNAELSLSDNESGVPAESDDFVTLGRLPIGTDLADLSRTY